MVAFLVAVLISVPPQVLDEIDSLKAEVVADYASGAITQSLEIILANHLDAIRLRAVRALNPNLSAQARKDSATNAATICAHAIADIRASESQGAVSPAVADGLVAEFSLIQGQLLQ